MTFGGLIRRSKAGRKASKRLPGRHCVNRPLVLEPLEVRLCPVLNLTAAGVNAGYTISTFATDFPNLSGSNVGPTGITFPDSGGVLVSSGNEGAVRHFPTDTDGQSALWFPSIPNYGLHNSWALAKVGANIYMTQSDLGKVVQVNDNGNFVQDIVSVLPQALGIVANPATGHLFVGHEENGDIFDVDPQAHTKTLFVNSTTNYGLAISPDGRTLYVARYSDAHVISYDTRTGQKGAFDSGSIADGTAGIVLGIGRFGGHLYVNTNAGTLIDIDLVTRNAIPIASGGVRGDMLAIDPHDGSLLVTTKDRIARLSFPIGPPMSFGIDAAASFVAGKPSAVIVTALDADGRVVTSYTGTVTFTSSDPYPGVLPSDYTFTSADKGKHAFGLSLFTATAQTLTAQDRANRSLTGTTTLSVHAAPASHLLMTAPPTAVAGTPFDVTITALDPYGNADPDYRGTVTFTSTDTAAGVVLPADYTFTSTDAGAHKFAGGATLLRAGSQTMMATDKTNSSFTASATVMVTPAPADHLLSTVPQTAVAGTLFDVALTAFDPYGNVDTNYTGTVTFVSTDTSAGAVLPSDYAFTHTDAGTHRFSGQATLLKAGSQTITATDTANGSITGSGTVMVTPAPANHFLITVPSTAVSGVPFDVALTAFDRYGNVDTNYTRTVTFASTDGDQGVILPADYTFQSTDNGTHTFTTGVTLITPGDQLLAATDTANGTITGSAIVTVAPSPVPPPAGGANRPWTPSIEPEITATGNVSSGREVAAVDRLFASLYTKNSGVILAKWKQFRQVDVDRGVLDFLRLEDTLLA
jgi:hypothetical protein